VTKQGFTLIELLIVLSIASIYLLIIMPVIRTDFLDKVSPAEKELNKILKDASVISKEQLDAVEITFIIGSGNIRLNNKVYELPDGIQLSSASLNDEPVSGLAFTAKVYPEEICDYIELNLSNNTTIVSLPLFNIVRLQE
jgi:prepilin-type N-terminal cleavage/methylation domain-containing protein